MFITHSHKKSQTPIVIKNQPLIIDDSYMVFTEKMKDIFKDMEGNTLWSLALKTETLKEITGMRVERMTGEILKIAHIHKEKLEFARANINEKGGETKFLMEQKKYMVFERGMTELCKRNISKLLLTADIKQHELETFAKKLITRTQQQEQQLLALYKVLLHTAAKKSAEQLEKCYMKMEESLENAKRNISDLENLLEQKFNEIIRAMEERMNKNTRFMDVDRKNDNKRR